jgi:RNA polymerase-binding protein DksA
VIKQLKHIRVHLEIERMRLTEELELKNAAEGHEGSPFGKRDETATERFELEKRLALTQHIRERLADMEYALEKLGKGTYGLCDFCCKPISFARLEAIPQATLCLDCKVLQAKNGKTRRSKST